ncbi:MAG: aminotransferase class V-fold PLP-dependent enzyme [Ignavibacteriae bacterium]|nr:aminotransferase class V-fold PLP-dependent enzyme [Ignavibacteria bacterium]MBI3363381.1 aminotransferase class V-fold PLP-dependent enzyme [Ignavibacteriota bacterium]
MQSTRRGFIKQVAGGVVGSLTLNTLPGTSALPFIVSPDDEEAWKKIREQFPLTHNRVYFNNGTMGPSPYPVIDAIKQALVDVDTRGEVDGWEAARPKAASFVKVDSTEISLTHNTTEGINIVAWGLPLKRGDEVILTTHEHAGNALPWLNRAHLDGIVLRTFTPASTAGETLTRISDLISPKTRAIAVPHITCTAGHVLPEKEIAKLGREKGLWTFFDGAHGPGMLPLDLKDIGCDFYAACGHKWMCGPKGTGFLYVRKEMLDVLQAKFIGAYCDTGWDLTTEPQEFKGYVPTAHRFDYATQSAPVFIGLAATVDFLNTIGRENISQRSRALAAHLQSKLLELGDRIDMLTPTEEGSRGAIVGFRIKKMPYDRFGQYAAKKGFRIRLVPESHLNSIRVSTHFYNSMEEVDRFAEVVKEVA